MSRLPAGECRHEPDVLRAAAAGTWSESLRDHVAGCTDCTAAAEVASCMSELSVVDEQLECL